MWYIPDDQVIKIQNRISDIREVALDDPVKFIAATHELLGTIDTVLFDERNFIGKDKSTMLLNEE